MYRYVYVECETLQSNLIVKRITALLDVLSQLGHDLSHDQGVTSFAFLEHWLRSGQTQ